MRRPLVGLTVGPEDGYLRLRTTYPRAIEAAGGLPVLVPPMEDTDALADLLERLDALVFPGGLDVDPAEYGEEPHPATEINPELDQLELAVAHWAVARDIPTLGICRGQQLLNVALGGTLVQHIDGHRQHEPRAALAHGMNVEPGSRLAEILGSTDVHVNTHHHQAVHRLGRGLRAVAWAPDGTIEAVESSEHPWLLAVQFHPEDLVETHEPSRRLFDRFVGAANVRLRAPV
jgi:gamma-glutamyl-gamma-aminobutyrate hydrolase PuuD